MSSTSVGLDLRPGDTVLLQRLQGQEWTCEHTVEQVGLEWLEVDESGQDREEVDRRTPLLVAGFLIVLGAITVGLALLASADGARHPVTAAAVVMAVTVYFGGQHLMANVRSRLHRRIDA